MTLRLLTEVRPVSNIAIKELSLIPEGILCCSQILNSLGLAIKLEESVSHSSSTMGETYQIVAVAEGM